jgi:hypothetical protein
MEDLSKDIEFFSMENMQHNEKLIEFCHTSMCVLSGCIAGIVGMTGLSGFTFMMAMYLMTGLAMLFLKMGSDLKVYSNSNCFSFLLGGVFGHGLSFILFWTLSYGLVHIY